MVQADSIKNKPKIIIISGPTAVGKSKIAVELAQALNTDIISADSMQIFRKLDIGTGKIKPTETKGITHHHIDIRNPDEEYSVGEFVTDCGNLINLLTANNKVPIIVGGTGLYINALINGYNLCSVPKSEVIRCRLKNRIETDGLNSLYSELKHVDPISANKIMPNDSKRIIRALEIYYVSGKTKSENEASVSEPEYDYLFFILEKQRDRLYADINTRVENMFSDGLVKEVKSLIQYKNCQSMQAIGYKEIVAAIENNLPAESALPVIQQNSRRYAKRQLTYFRGLKANKITIDAHDFSKISKITNHFINNMPDIPLD